MGDGKGGKEERMEEGSRGGRKQRREGLEEGRLGMLIFNTTKKATNLGLCNRVHS